MNDAQFSSAQARALILSKAIKRRDDVRVRTLIDDFAGALDYEGYGLEELAISGKAWVCVKQLQIEPRMVFAHPDMLQQHPETSLYYRGIATLSLKRVSSTVRMAYGSEPDIVFEKYDEQTQNWALEVTIEIKGGMDPAGALERLGAIKKSFDQTPARVENIAILGVVTPAMRAELDQMRIVDFDLYEVVHSKKGWDRFVEELFYHKLRLLPWKN